jgi:hypothetical protein
VGFGSPGATVDDVLARVVDRRSVGGRQAASTVPSAAAGRACGGICGFAGIAAGWRLVRLSANVDGGVTDGLRVDGWGLFIVVALAAVRRLLTRCQRQQGRGRRAVCMAVYAGSSAWATGWRSVRLR